MSETTQTTKVTYDPSKNYSWNPTDKFEFSGQEYAYMLGVLNNKRTELLQQLEVLTILERKLIDAVESGVATEVVPEDNNEDSTSTK